MDKSALVPAPEHSTHLNKMRATDLEEEKSDDKGLSKCDEVGG